jgi:hypothetical protein
MAKAAWRVARLENRRAAAEADTTTARRVARLRWRRDVARGSELCEQLLRESDDSCPNPGIRDATGLLLETLEAMTPRHRKGVEVGLLRNAFMGAHAAEHERADRTKLSPAKNGEAFDRALDALTAGPSPRAKVEGGRVLFAGAGHGHAEPRQTPPRRNGDVERPAEAERPEAGPESPSSILLTQLKELSELHPDGVRIELLRVCFGGALVAERDRVGRPKPSPLETAETFDRTLGELAGGHRPQIRVEDGRVLPATEARAPS